MKRNHLLLQNIESKQVGSIDVLNDFLYDILKGVWSDNNGKLMIEHKEFFGVASKKKDIETGEDQK